jgi:hypothetical protein
MGYFMNAEIIEHCILLAQETFHEGDFAVCRSFLESAKTALNIFPSMSEKGFDYLVELFSECQASQPTEDRKQINQYAITTTLSGMLARTASTRGSPSKEKVSIIPLRIEVLHLLLNFSHVFLHYPERQIVD